MSRGQAGLAAALVAAGLLSSGCGRDIEPRTYDPPQEQSAGRWSTWVVGDPARLRVPPPPRAGSPEAKEDLREVERVTEGRDIAGERSARYWALEPTVRPWLDAGLNAVTLGDMSPPEASRGYALLSVAMHDAAVATWHWKYAYRRKAPPGKPLLPHGKDPSYPSEHAAIAAAAARVLTYAFDRPADRYRRIARTAARSRVLAGTNYPSDAEAGLRLGRAVGDAVVARARRDGFGRKWDGARPTGRGSWDPPPGSRAAPVEPLAGSWRPWVLRSGDELRPPAPAAFDSPAFKAQARRVRELRDNLTVRRRRLAGFWEAGEDTPFTPGLWNQIALSRIDRRGLSTPRVARLFALLNVAMADAGVAAWDAKYAYWSPRPVNAIRDLRLDRSWRPFLRTPASPAFVSASSAYSAAAAGVLGQVFPGDARRFARRAREAGDARVYGGVSFPRDVAAGRRIGRRVGELVARRARGDGAGR